MGTDHPTHRPVSRLARAVMSLFAAPRVNMREDYEKVRRLQRQMAALPAMRYHDLDREVRSADGGHSIPVRVFEPSAVRRDEVLLFFHGGGWVTGDIDSYTPACLTMAELTGAVVASVDYRLAPEYPFPAGLEDCHRIARLVLDEPDIAGVADPSRIVMVGDSAGANLAAVTNLMLREQHSAMPGRQVLLYPVTHWDHDPQTSPFASVREHGADYRLTNTEVQDYLELYAPDPAQRRSPRVSPLMATDLSGQPDTLLISAELDLLCDEGEAYGRRLQEAGNRVRIHRVPGALHGFITLPRFARPLREAYEQINAFLDEDAGGERP
ncbi:Lipase [Acidipropionibacterium acidipropionici ATCC 4875]|uniref:Lipase n=1 Tax=Acidipropionibacterium acidipropionici (strain ATCC 4875 / DSM 20272 / JCM 6432 / NBRC 12425 / NCIMB 8070 / 4) TaxID=1171373 RepID=K7RR78_ACIA4|nr:alpha/beta hydrolase [Acidipropionibacterium acidipropionici]AFV88811.1 Lipase [Acidipropionibacterium acidipropionici ATCC 4875]ALN16575.1 alpha/beta hydrolase [Acidipropionibacterium acidipropionici]APZ10370.1 alpha/beta hydrolase [Acidipropionibacterium acidipropionici]